MSYLVLGFIIPIIVAFKDGTTYAFAFGIIGFGVTIYFLAVALMRIFIGRRAPSTLENGTWEQTAGWGVVPKWVSKLGLISFGLVLSGLVVATLLFLGFIIKRS